jgi:hypothetical protein
VGLTDFLWAGRHTGSVLHTFDTPPKSRVAEGWTVAAIVMAMVFLLWLAI